MKVARRGKFNTLVTRAGDTVVAELYGCTVVREPHLSSGKTYATLDVAQARGSGVAVLRNVDVRIRREAAPEFSPLRPDGTLVIKIPPHVRCETREGAAAPQFTPCKGQVVDAVLRLGAFGAFGYCWLATRLKPHSPEDEVSGVECTDAGV